MKIKSIPFVLLLIGCLFMINCNNYSSKTASNPKSGDIKISISQEKLTYKFDEIIYIKYNILNQKFNNFKIPEWFYVGFNDDDNSEIAVYVQEKFCFFLYDDVSLVTNHYNYYKLNRTFQIFKINDTINSSFALNTFYYFNKKNSYRIKIGLRLKRLFYEEDEVFSNWLNFDVIE